MRTPEAEASPRAPASQSPPLLEIPIAEKPGPAPDTAPETPASDPPPARVVARIPSDIRGMDAFAVFSPLSKKYPEDFRLGPLGKSVLPDQEDKPFVEAARNFLKGLVSGRFSPDFVAPELRPMLGSLINEALDPDMLPESFRMSALTSRADGTVSINVRLLSSVGRTEGEIVFDRRSGSIFIIAFLVDLSLLRKEAPQTEKFEPDTYTGFFP